MKKIFVNQYSINLMKWETNPVLRNKNNEVSFYIDEKQEVNISDLLIGEYSVERCSTYEIVEILERRKGALNGKDYITCKTLHSFKYPVFSEFEIHSNDRFKKLFNLK